VMLTNRQPTLHKPGMMSHRARILQVRAVLRERSGFRVCAHGSLPCMCAATMLRPAVLREGSCAIAVFMYCE
jgi:hypothetical protein